MPDLLSSIFQITQHLSFQNFQHFCFLSSTFPSFQPYGRTEEKIPVHTYDIPAIMVVVRMMILTIVFIILLIALLTMILMVTLTMILMRILTKSLAMILTATLTMILMIRTMTRMMATNLFKNLFPKSDIQDWSRCRKVVASTNALVVEVQSYGLAQKHIQQVDWILRNMFVLKNIRFIFTIFLWNLLCPCEKVNMLWRKLYACVGVSSKHSSILIATLARLHL